MNKRINDSNSWQHVKRSIEILFIFEKRNFDFYSKKEEPVLVEKKGSKTANCRVCVVKNNTTTAPVLPRCKRCAPLYKDKVFGCLFAFDDDPIGDFLNGTKRESLIHLLLFDS